MSNLDIDYAPWEKGGMARLLVVDDNPDIHRDFDLVLCENHRDIALEAEEQFIYGAVAIPGISKRVYKLDHAFSGLEGIEKTRSALAEDNPYQVAFVDVRMPGIDGVETIDRIWQIDQRIQVVICTAYADYSWADLANRLGTTDKLLVLKKPFDHIELTQLAGTLGEKWFLARKAAMKMEQMELLVARRTQKILGLQRQETKGPLEAQSAAGEPATFAGLTNLTPSEPAPSGGELPLILFFDAVTGRRSLIVQALAAQFQIIELADCAEALRKAEEIVPDLVIAGVIAPELGGMELCRCLKAGELTSHIPVVILSADGSESNHLKALEAGADDFIAAPVSVSLLKARLRNLMDSHRKLHPRAGAESSWRPRDMAVNQTDAQFLRRLIDTVEKYSCDYEFDVDAVAQRMAVSRRQLFRKLKAVTDCTPNYFIRAARLKRAAQLLKESQMTVTEITYAVGFVDLKHFRTVFREQFGVSPGEYAKRS
jgi:YesN/AraC family two-component response regulator